MLKCRDAIEQLHLELEDERQDKHRLIEEVNELTRVLQEVQMSEQDRQFRMQKLTEDSIQLQGDVLVLSKEKERL